MKKYLVLMCFALFFFSCRHDNGNEKTNTQTLPTPTDLTATATGKTGEVELSWQAVANASSYVVSYKKTGATGAETAQNVEKTKTTYLVSSLEDDVQYSFFILAKGDGSAWLDSEKSAEVTATPKVQTTPQKLVIPTNFKVFSVNKEGALYATWKGVTNNNGYTIKCVVEGESEKLFEVEKDRFFETITGLTQGKEYSVSIMTKAGSEFSPSDYSEVVKCKTVVASDVLVLEKIEIEGQTDIMGDSFTELSISDEGNTRHINSNGIVFKVTTEEKTITPHFAGSNLKSYEIFKVEGIINKKLENNKIKFENDMDYSFMVVAKTKTDLVVNYEFEGRALEGTFDVQDLLLKDNYTGGDDPSTETLEETTKSTMCLINPKLRNTANLKLNIKKDATLGANQKLLFMLSLSNDSAMQKVEFDSAEAKTTTIENIKYYYKVLTPNSSGKVTLNAKFTLKSKVVDQRSYEFTMSDAKINTDIKAVTIGTQDFEPLAMPSSQLTIYVPKKFGGKSYPVNLKLENNATYNLYFADENFEFKKVVAGSKLKIDAEEENEIQVDIIPEIGDGLYSWNEVTIQIIVGAKDAPSSPNDILIGDVSVKAATSKDKAVAIDFKDIEENIVVKLTKKEDDECTGVAICTIEEWKRIEKLSQREKLMELKALSEDDFSSTEGREFVLILSPEGIIEGYKAAVYHVWLKKK